MKKPDLKHRGRLVLLSAAIYFLLDLSVQLTGFLQFGPLVGIKNFLPSTLGLQLGPWGIVGGCIGCVLSALVLDVPTAYMLTECVCILVVGMIVWLGWHAGSTSCLVHFKRPMHYLKYAGLLLGSAVVSGLISFLLIPGGAFPEILATYLSLGLLVGIPVNIMANSLFCLEPVLPPPHATVYALDHCVDSDPESLTAFNEAFEDLAFEKHIAQRRVFEIENCIEELTIRILSANSSAKIRIRLNYDDTISARLTYAGEKYNPLKTSRDEDEFAIMSLKLIKQRALRASYRYADDTNLIHVVI